ncbi:MAG TPA: MBL fold metallo-hydrolase [Vicinamibacterales bacterium]|nr:MBL fold metallo-hydrolase [Vicinamibacterales bacterium]
MRRTIVLGIIVLTGVITAAMVSAQQAPAGARGQGGGGGRGGGFTFPPIQPIEKVKDNLYMIQGEGGNTAVYVAENGVVLVDTKVADKGQAILDQVKKVTDKPITTIINTHTHGDHTGSNQFFPASVDIIVQDNTAANMKKMEVFQQEANKNGLPDRTFKDKTTLLKGKDEIDLYYFGPAHTNGDAFVVFKSLQVMHAGDAFANKGQPLIDRNNGGSGVQYPDTLTKAAKGIKNVTTVINGHTTMTTTWQDFVDYGEFNRLFLAHARESMKAGKSPEQAMMDFKLPEKFKGYNLAGGRGGPGGNFGIIYEELKGAR